ncbi:MAG: hypothetical protein PWR01_2646 [Clostridiales bacterium]|nr:hypothetical protein [Clostridiales bacterium]MDN5281573.1 hypothetical protein [Candidatus Ozemobacter sp.]
MNSFFSLDAKIRSFYLEGSILLLLFWGALSPICFADSLELLGSVPFIDIQRSTSENWVSVSTLLIKADITTAGTSKIVIGVDSVDQSAWQGRYLRVKLENQADWLAISNLADFRQIDLVKNGIFLPGSAVLVRHLNIGVHPHIPMNYESWANKDAIPGVTQLTVTLTILSE